MYKIIPKIGEYFEEFLNPTIKIRKDYSLYLENLNNACFSKSVLKLPSRTTNLKFKTDIFEVLEHILTAEQLLDLTISISYPSIIMKYNFNGNTWENHDIFKDYQNA